MLIIKRGINVVLLHYLSLICCLSLQISEKVIRRLRGEIDLPLKGDEDITQGGLFCIFMCVREGMGEADTEYAKYTVFPRLIASLE